ncbi:MAG: ABC transporter ATP-binding protein, partial [Pseudobdellovibrionaceae bacterium]
EEKLFTQLIDGAWAERSRLLVTHRLNILNRVDRILFMQDGSIIDSGTFSELMGRSQLFRDYTQSVVEASSGG